MKVHIVFKRQEYMFYGVNYRVIAKKAEQKKREKRRIAEASKDGLNKRGDNFIKLLKGGKIDLDTMLNTPLAQTTVLLVPRMSLDSGRNL